VLSVAEIPKSFNADNVLDPGTYEVSFTDLRSSLLVIGDGSSINWDSILRSSLVDNLEILTKQLWSVGIEDVFIDGSFVENKDQPNDIDGYFDTKISSIGRSEMKRLEDQVSQLNKLDPYKIWNWEPLSRIFDPRSGKAQLPMWMRYRVELYPHIEGMFSGIRDAHGNNLKFPSAFRQSRRNFIPKGIVKIIP
jgi:hypothetical protein